MGGQRQGICGSAGGVADLGIELALVPLEVQRHRGNRRLNFLRGRRLADRVTGRQERRRGAPYEDKAIRTNHIEKKAQS